MGKIKDRLWIWSFYQVIYPSISPQDFHQEQRMKLQLLDPKDLSVKQIIETSTTTKQIGHIFMMCGVLYATEPDGKKDGIIRYLIFWDNICSFQICNRYDKRQNEKNSCWLSRQFPVSWKNSSLISKIISVISCKCNTTCARKLFLFGIIDDKWSTISTLLCKMNILNSDNLYKELLCLLPFSIQI